MSVASGGIATELDWMALRVEVLFTHGANERMIATREPNASPAPRFYLGRTRQGNLWRFRSDLDPDLVRSLARLAGREAAMPADAAPPEAAMPADVAPPERMQAFRDVLKRGGEIHVEHAGPAFDFPTSSSAAEPTLQSDGRLIELSAGSEELLRQQDFEALAGEIGDRLPAFALEVDGRVVSVCHCARRLVGHAAEAGVETLSADRGNGHAPLVVAAWAREIARLGERPLYSTSWQNAASRSVARKLGLVCLGEDIHFS